MTVDRWLTCIECRDGERAALVALGAAAVPALEAALSGPPQETRAALQTHLSSKWQRTTAYLVARNESPAMTESQYIQLHLGNFTALMQTRAAEGLAAVHTQAALATLQAAMDAHQTGAFTYRSDVVAALQSALDQF